MQIGSNILINRYLPRNQSILYKFDKLSGQLDEDEESKRNENAQELWKQQALKEIYEAFSITDTELRNGI